MRVASSASFDTIRHLPFGGHLPRNDDVVRAGFVKARVLVDHRPRLSELLIQLGHGPTVGLQIARLPEVGLHRLGSLSPITAHVDVPLPRHRVVEVGRRERCNREDAELLDLPRHGRRSNRRAPAVLA